MLDIKKWIAKVTNWIKYPIVTVPWPNGETGIKSVYKDSQNPTNNVGVSLMVGNGHINHGVWSEKQSRWLIHGDASSVYVGGYKLDINTNNTSDTWALVMNGANIQHAVLGGLARKSVVSAPMTVVSETKNSPAISANAVVQIDVPINAPADTQLIGVVACTISNNSGKTGAGSIVLRGFDVDGFGIGGSNTVKTYWRNATSTAYAASQFHVTVQATCMKVQNIS